MLHSAEQLYHSNKAFELCAQDKVAIKKWLEAAQRKVRDAEFAENSFDTRFEAYYDACFNVALVVVNAEGWKPKSTDGHHQHTLEAACSATGTSDGLHARVDAIRLLRNQKYTGASRTQRDVDGAKKAFEEFWELAFTWLKANHPSVLQS